MSVSDDEESGGAVLVVRVQAVSGAASACVLVNERTTYQQLLADTDAQLAQQQSLAAVPSSSSPPNPAVTDTSVAAPAAVGVAAEENANAEKRENSRAPPDLCVVPRDPAPVRTLAEFAHERGLDLVSACARILSDDATSMVFGDRAAVARRAADVDAAMVVESALGRRAAGVRVAHDTTVAQFLTDVVDVVAVAAPTDAYAARLLESDLHMRFASLVCAPAAFLDSDQYLIGQLCGLPSSSGASLTTSGGGGGGGGGARTTWLDRLSHRPSTASSRAAGDLCSPAIAVHLCDATLADKGDSPLPPLLRLFVDGGRAAQLLSEALRLELSRTSSTGTLMRGTSVVTRMLSLYGRLTGKAYLDDVLKPVLQHILAQVAKGASFEVDPNKVRADIATVTAVAAPPTAAPVPTKTAMTKRLSVGKASGNKLRVASGEERRRRRSSLNLDALGRRTASAAAAAASSDNSEDTASSSGSRGAGDADVPGVVVMMALDMNQRRLVDVCNRLILSVLDSSRNMPLAIRRACCVLRHGVAAVFPEAAATAVGSFFFLRFLSVAIATPHEFGLVDAELDRGSLRAAVLLGKVVQHLANGTRFSAREPHMQPFNALLIAPNEKKVRAFLNDLGDPLAFAAAVAAHTESGGAAEKPILSRLTDAPTDAASAPSSRTASERLRDLYCIRDALVAHYPKLVAFAKADSRTAVLERLVSQRRVAERLREWSRAYAVAGSCVVVPIEAPMEKVDKVVARRSGFLRWRPNASDSGSSAQLSHSGPQSTSSGKLDTRRVHVMATIVNYGKSTAGARMQLQCVGVLGEPSELWPANATLPAVHERLLERYAAGLRYVYGTEAEAIEYATSHQAPHPQLSRELLDAIEDGGVVVSINADQRGDAGDAVPPLGGDGAPTLEKRLGGGAGHDVESLTARRSGDGPVFGRSLEQGCFWHGVRHATPVLLQRAVHYLNSHPDVLVTEGLFRVPGDAKVVQLLRQRFDDGLDVDLSSVPGITVHVVASLLGQYLRQSRPAAIPSSVRARFVAYAQVPPRHQVDYLRVVLNELPSAHVRSLDLLCAFLLRLASHESVTRMSIANLALVFGPCLVAADEVDIEDPLALRVASEQANDVVAFLIEHHADLFLTHVDTERLGTAVATVRDTYVPDANSGELMLRHKQPLFLLRRLEPSDVTRWRAANAALAAASVSAEDIQRRRSVPKGAGISHQSLSMLFPRSRASVPFASACTGEGGAADLDTDAASASSATTMTRQ
jgi:hypothetical protein